MFSAEQRAELRKKLPADQIKHRRESGRQLSYIEGFQAIDTANEIFGHEGWGYEVKETQYHRVADALFYTSLVRVWALAGEGRVERMDVGVGDVAYSRDRGPESASADAHGTAIKASVTDGLKRALRTFGSRWGNDLYDKDDQSRDDRAPASQSTPRQEQRPVPAPQAASAPQAPTERPCPTCGGPMALKEGKSAKTGLPWRAWACQKGRDACGQALIFVRDDVPPSPPTAPQAAEASVPDLAREWAKLRELLSGQGFSPDEAKRYYHRNTEKLGCPGTPPTAAQWLKLFGAAARAEDVDAAPSAERQTAAF